MPRPAIPQPALCLVTDRRLCQDAPLTEKVAQAVQGGVDIVQLREKDLPGRPLLEIAMKLKEAINGKALLIVNERVDVALLADADGVHLGETALTPSQARSLSEAPIIIGRSVHDYDGAIEAQRQGADYLIAGSVYATSSHPGQAPQGLQLLQNLPSELSIPTLGIGGINVQNAPAVIHAGASGVAVISAILASPQPKEAARRLKSAILDAWLTRKGAPA